MGRVEAPRAVLWDLDGTLADSRDYHWRAWKKALDDIGVQVTEAQFEASFGQRNDAILAEWLGADADPELVRRVGDEKEAIYRGLVTSQGIEPLPGAAEWIRALDGAGWRQAIASSAPRLNVEVMHRVLGFGDRIQVLVGAEDVSAGKPDPEVFLKAAELLGVAPARCVVVEDAAAGVDAGRRGGMATVGVGGVEGADRTVRQLTDLAPDTFEALLDR